MESIGPFRVLGPPMKGGFGLVYHVFDGDSGDEFALKTPYDPFHRGRAERFQREVRHWISLPTHRNVVRAIRAFTHGRRPYLLLEWCAAGNLRANIHRLRYRDRPPSMHGAATALAVMRQICAGMTHIHEHDIVHGDLKPSNILMWGGTSPQIADFGLAHALNDERDEARSGTTGYLAPEFAETGPSRLSDIYAAGVLLDELLDGFGIEDFGFEEGLALAARMRADNPATRPSTFAEVEAALTELIDGAPWPPSLLSRGDERPTWDEQHVMAALPGRTAINTAATHEAAGRRDEAIAILRQAVQDDERYAKTRIHLATYLLLRASEGDREESLDHLGAAAAVASEPLDLLNIAQRMVAAGEEGLAKTLLDSHHSVSDGHPGRVAMIRARIAEGEGDLTEALGHWRHAAATEPSTDARFGLALCLRAMGMNLEAAEILHALRTDPDLGIDASNRLAQLYIDIGRYDMAATELAGTLQRAVNDDQRGWIYVEMGYAYRCAGQFEAAENAYRQALQLSPESEQAAAGLELAEQRKRPKEALLAEP